ncbi:hypothetical protein F5882DRAFT_431506 [Hyaloscypha sp. PMI_1271]|nr:hypothetical protein F5882DRAFT_431506 [Hyaloscypha sp. PMI_1271]
MAEIGLAASVIAVIDLSAKVALWCSEYSAKVKNAKDDIERLQGETQKLKETLKHVQSLCDSPNGAKLQASKDLCDGVKDCETYLSQLDTKLAPRKREKVMSRCGIHALRWSFTSNEVDGIIKKLDKCRDNISFNLQVDQTYVLLSIFCPKAQVDNIEYRAEILKIKQEIVLNKLKSVDNAAFDSYAEEHNSRCYQGTRAELLRQILAQIFSDEGKLGASFFFKRGEGDRGHAEMLFTTIAAQLVQKLPSLAPHVHNAIEADPAIPTKTLKQQFDTLVSEPLGRLCFDPQKPSTIVIVVDALDECAREEDVRVMIRLFSQAKRLSSVRLKFFLTSRPELPIRLGFGDISGSYECLALHQIPEPIIEHDISAFLEYELARIRNDYNKSVPEDRHLSPNWPGQTNIQSLVQMAIPLFIFATTTCRFIKDRRCGEPGDQLAKVLKYKTKSQESELDATYLPILDQLLIGLTSLRKDEVVRKFKEVVGTIVILASPLSTISLARLLDISKARVDQTLDLLHSVLSIPSNADTPVRLLHLSFRDFLLDTEKREKHLFWIDAKDVHKILATKCLDRLSLGECLKKDICDLRTPGRPRADIDKQTIDAHLPLDIQYACQYWVYHAKECGSVIRDDDQAHNFLQCHFLHWLEALSLMGRVSESISMIDDLIAMLDPMINEKASAFLYDAKRFILNCLSIADSSPLQLYSAALVFAPKRSVVRNTFQNYMPDWISQQPDVELSWNAVLQTLEGHSNLVQSVAFSHDARLLASASDDKTVKVWDTTTGALQQTLEGHSSSVSSVAFSHDSRLLASASDDNTVKVWDIAIGTLQQTLEGHSSLVSSVAFSHESKLLVSASWDKTVKVWNAATGVLQQTLEGHSSWVNSVAFSHDSKLLVSASSDNTVKQTLEGHSASNDETVKVWDIAIAKATLQQTLEGHNDWVRSIAFSHNSKLLASAVDDCTVKVWHAATGILRQTLKGHSGWLRSVAFSHNSKLLASASNDGTVKVWDVATGILQQTLDDDSVVRSVAFSHDSKLLASASYDKTVKVWNAATGTLQQTIAVNSYVSTLSFDITNSILITNIGRIKVDRARIPSFPTSSQEVSSKSDREGLGICGPWIIWNDQKLLWLPPDFRAETSGVSRTGSKLAIACQSGKVFVIGISQDILHRYYS